MVRPNSLGEDRGPWELSGSPGDRRSHEEPEQHALTGAWRIESVAPYPPSPALGCWAPLFGAGCTREVSQRTVARAESSERLAAKCPRTRASHAYEPVQADQELRHLFQRPDGTSRRCVRP